MALYFMPNYGAGSVLREVGGIYGTDIDYDHDLVPLGPAEVLTRRLIRIAAMPSCKEREMWSPDADKRASARNLNTAACIRRYDLYLFGWVR
ncbi:hypothetical protein CCHR01_17546 [Colletotrichum chrysophilum]|uniref:Uncharacterized protein n=1 Tax=Colletotrichum chrysophilum TaxID=1836956 RepID=A0AAD9A289_9PEZI|nr:hypothetical protein CCHR01_17546 [Colletotrichum chrysophilum]